MEQDLKWSTAFCRIIAIRKEFSAVIDDLSVSETSLEDIFLHIAREASPDFAEIETSEM